MYIYVPEDGSLVKLQNYPAQNLQQKIEFPKVLPDSAVRKRSRFA